MSRASVNMERTDNDSTETVNIAAEKRPSDYVATHAENYRVLS